MRIPSRLPLAPAVFFIVGPAVFSLISPLAAAPGHPTPAARRARECESQKAAGLPRSVTNRPFRGGCDTDRPAGALEQLAASLTRRWKARILVDPSIAPDARPERPGPDLPIEQALDMALSPLRGVAWRRLRVPRYPSEAMPSAAALAAAVRALLSPDPGGMLVEDPATGHATACLKELRLTPSLEATLRSAKLDPDPVYLIFSTVPLRDELPPPGRIADLQRQQLALPLPPEQQALAMAQMVRLLQALPPADAEGFASRTLAAGMRLWDSTPAAQREEMIQQSLQMVQAFGAAPSGPAARGQEREPAQGDAAPRQRVPGDTRALAAALTDRYGTPFLVDPSLLLPAPASLPAADLPAEKALSAVAHLLPGAIGRRVYLPPAPQKRQPSPERLAAAARELENMAPFTLVIENPARERATVYWKDAPADMMPRLIELGRLSDAPLSLLYNATPAARGGSLEERVADLQRQQMGLLLRMSPEEMAQAADGVIHTFAGADPEMRSRLMSLPAMAGLMAAWMPRAAKERQQPNE